MNIKKILQNKYYPKDLVSHLLRTTDCSNCKRVLDLNKKIQDNIRKNRGELRGTIKV